jgi:DNA-binding XRE family transcriptional regulator
MTKVNETKVLEKYRAENIERRKSWGLNQSQMGEAIGVSAQRINQWESSGGMVAQRRYRESLLKLQENQDMGKVSQETTTFRLENIERRNQYNLSQSAMAKLLGVGRMTLYRWETTGNLRAQEKYDRLMTLKLEGGIRKDAREPHLVVSSVKPNVNKAIRGDVWSQEKHGLIALYWFDGNEWILKGV